MPWNGSGVYAAPAASFPEVNATVIDAVRYDAVIVDLATGITNSLAKDGQNSPTNNIPMAAFKLQNLGVGAAAGEALTFFQAAAKLADLLIEAASGTLSINATTAANNAVVFLQNVGVSLGLIGLAGQADAIVTGSLTNDLLLRSSGKRIGLSIDSGTSLGLLLDAVGRLSGNALHNNASGLTGTTRQYIGSGIYTPVVSATGNISANTPKASHWIRVGNVVTVAGALDITRTGAGNVLGELSLPIASNFILPSNCGGFGGDTTSGTTGTIAGNTATEKAGFTLPTVSPSSTYTFSFTYLIQ